MWPVIPDYEKLVAPAKEKELQEEIKQFYEDRKESLGEITFDLPHLRFIVYPENIGQNLVFPLKPSNFRVVEFTKGKDLRPIAIHELSLNPDNPKLLSTKLGKRVLNAFVESIRQIDTKSKKEKTGGEIRQLSVLGLNIEAIWYQYGDKTRNEFYWADPSSETLKIKVTDGPKFLEFLNVEKKKFEEMKSKKQKGDTKKDDGKQNEQNNEQN